MLPFGFISVLSVFVAGVVARVELAPRAVPSAGGNCYFKCDPEVAGYPFSLLSSEVDPLTGNTFSRCIYGDGDYFGCDYDPETGSSLESYPLCPNRDLETTVCTSSSDGNPDTRRYFKRSLQVRKLSPAERRIRALQYKPGGEKARRDMQYKRTAARDFAQKN